MARQRRWHRWAGPARRLPMHSPFFTPNNPTAHSQYHNLAFPSFAPPRTTPPFFSTRRFGRQAARPTWAAPHIPFQTAPAMSMPSMPMQINRQMRRRSRIYAGQLMQNHGYYPPQAPAHSRYPGYKTQEPYYLIPATTVNSLFQQQQTKSSVPHFEEMDAAARKARNRGSRIIGPPPLRAAVNASHAARGSPQNLGHSQTMPSMHRSDAASSRSRAAIQQPTVSLQQRPTPVLGRSKSLPPTLPTRPTGRIGTPKPAITRAASAPPQARSVPLASARSSTKGSLVNRAARQRSSETKPSAPAQTVSKPPSQVNVRRAPQKNCPTKQPQVHEAPPPDMPSSSRAVPAGKTLDRVIAAQHSKQATSQSIKAPNPANPGLPISSLNEGDPVTILRPGHLSNHLGIVHEIRNNRYRAKDTKVFDWKDGGTQWYDSKRELAEAPLEERRRARPPAKGVPATAQVFDQTNLPPLSLSV